MGMTGFDGEPEWLGEAKKAHCLVADDPDQQLRGRRFDSAHLHLQ